jgi:hypothetical protein
VIVVIFDDGTDLVGEAAVLVHDELVQREEAGRVAVAEPQPGR